MSSHGNQEITDPVEQMLKKTGCIDLHYKVQECIADTKDWRKCQDPVADFKKCMEQYQEKRLKESV
ncbi:cytochrome c oxidase assembly factor 4 homolog, mitochondrial [Anoplophora glabripennis]|uniref:cytochrome c oxidase assembly factor 4 homolog, mitochondrial n=1 Tax=Anoplophora glabripennis TaxID=217634 RepID=UPI0008757DE0|nr:cytochrome c oxidase assembly factor 4 homolog, mitochondrial [Anoplophora glabripennis]